MDCQQAMIQLTIAIFNHLALCSGGYVIRLLSSVVAYTPEYVDIYLTLESKDFRIVFAQYHL